MMVKSPTITVTVTSSGNFQIIGGVGVEGSWYVMDPSKVPSTFVGNPFATLSGAQPYIVRGPVSNVVDAWDSAKVNTVNGALLFYDTNGNQRLVFAGTTIYSVNPFSNPPYLLDVNGIGPGYAPPGYVWPTS